MSGRYTPITSKEILQRDSILIATATVAGYALAFAYQAGSYLVYRVPLDFIVIDWTHVFLVAFAIYAIVSLMWRPLFTAVDSSQISPTDDALLRRIKYISLPWTFLLIFMIVDQFILIRFALVLAGFIVIALFLFVRPLFGNKGSYTQRLSAQDGKYRARNLKRSEAGEQPGGVLKIFDKIFPPLALVLYLVFSIGQTAVLNKNSIIVTNADHGCAVVTYSQNNYLCAVFDFTKQKFTGQYKVVPYNARTSFTPKKTAISRCTKPIC